MVRKYEHSVVATVHCLPPLARWSAGSKPALNSCPIPPDGAAQSNGPRDSPLAVQPPDVRSADAEQFRHFIGGDSQPICGGGRHSGLRQRHNHVRILYGILVIVKVKGIPKVEPYFSTSPGLRLRSSAAHSSPLPAHSGRVFLPGRGLSMWIAQREGHPCTHGEGH